METIRDVALSLALLGLCPALQALHQPDFDRLHDRQPTASVGVGCGKRSFGFVVAFCSWQTEHGASFGDHGIPTTYSPHVIYRVPKEASEALEAADHYLLWWFLPDGPYNTPTKGTLGSLLLFTYIKDIWFCFTPNHVFMTRIDWRIRKGPFIPATLYLFRKLICQGDSGQVWAR